MASGLDLLEASKRGDVNTALRLLEDPAIDVNRADEVSYAGIG